MKNVFLSALLFCRSAPEKKICLKVCKDKTRVTRVRGATTHFVESQGATVPETPARRPGVPTEWERSRVFFLLLLSATSRICLCRAKFVSVYLDSLLQNQNILLTKTWRQCRVMDNRIGRNFLFKFKWQHLAFLYLNLCFKFLYYFHIFACLYHTFLYFSIELKLWRWFEDKEEKLGERS